MSNQNFMDMELPPTWAATVDLQDHWERKEREAQLPPCEWEDPDDDSYPVPNEIFEEHDGLMFDDQDPTDTGWEDDG